MAINPVLLRCGRADADAAKESCGGAAWAMAGRIGEISGTVFASGEHRKPG